MKKKNLLYILTLIITFFSCGLNVNAAKEATYKTKTTLGTFTNKTCDSINTADKWQELDKSKYHAACLYEYNLDSGCHVVQLNIEKNGNFLVLQDDPGVLDKTVIMEFQQDKKTLNLDAINNKYDGNCPNEIYVDRVIGVNPGTATIDATVTLINDVNNSFHNTYELIDVYGSNLKNEGVEQSIEAGDFNFGLVKNELPESCEELFGNDEDLLKTLKSVISLSKFLIPIILLGLGILDFAKAIFAGEEDKMRKAQKKFINRVIIGVAIFLIPSVLRLLLTIANTIWPTIDPNLCGLI